MHDGGDADSYSLQLNEKQAILNQQAFERLGENAFQTYAQVPLGFYVQGMLREASHRDYDDALKCYSEVCQLCPTSQPFQWDRQRAQSGVHSNPGSGVLYVFALVGRGPMKVEAAEEPTSDALLIADRIVSAVGPYSVPPTLAPIKVPRIMLPPIEVDRVGVAINQQPIGPTESIANIERLALDTSEANHKTILARAVARRVLKKASIVAAKNRWEPIISRHSPWMPPELCGKQLNLPIPDAGGYSPAMYKSFELNFQLEAIKSHLLLF